MIDAELLTIHTERLAARLRDIAESLHDSDKAAAIEGVAAAVERLPQDSDLIED